MPSAPCTPFRRIVTGHDKDGRSIVLEDVVPTRVHRLVPEGGPIFHEVWQTSESPARMGAKPEREPDTVSLLPPTGGTLLRVVDVPPDIDGQAPYSRAVLAESFKAVGAPDAVSQAPDETLHASMHRTVTIDYGIVLAGEITVITERGEATAYAGDVIIQRGTNHGWSNRSAAFARIAFVLVDGCYEEALAGALGS